MTYARDPYDTDEPPCFCPVGSPEPSTTQEFCPAHGDPAKPAPEPPVPDWHGLDVSEMTDAQIREMAGAEPPSSVVVDPADLRWVLPGLEPAAEFMPPKTKAAYERLRAIAGMSAPHTVHYHWPPRCGFASVPEGDTWSGDLDLVNCPGCREG